MGPCQALMDPGVGTAWGRRPGNQKPSPLSSPNGLQAATLGQVPDNSNQGSHRAEFKCVAVDKLLNF